MLPPVLPEGRAEAARQAADLRIVRRQHVGEDGDEGDEQQDQHRDQRKPFQPPEGGGRRDGVGGGGDGRRGDSHGRQLSKRMRGSISA